jgi:NTE family protein
VIAERLHTTLTRGVAAAPRPVVVLHRSPGWASTRAFAVALASALAEELAGEALVAHGAGPAGADPTLLRPHVWHVTDGGGQAGRAPLAEQLTSWTSRFGALVLDWPSATGALDLRPLATHHVWLLGPGEPPPHDLDSAHIVVQDASGPALPALSARRRLVDLAGAERALTGGAGAPAPLKAAAAALARGICGRQIGLALGGGGAWGWAHIGVLDVLERAGVPIDAIAGCSMGSLVGGLRASGASIADLRAVADYWKHHHKKWAEYRFWRLHVANERRMQNAFRHMFGDRRLTTFATPFWANAIDIENAEEVVIKDGTLVDAVRGSMAFPGWTPPVRRGDRWLVDAALIDPVPAALVKQMHCDQVIAVNTLGAMTPQTLESRWPKQAYAVMGRYLRIAAHEVGRIHGDIAAGVTITPEVGETTMLSFDKSEELIEAGRKAADERLPLIREAARHRPI